MSKIIIIGGGNISAHLIASYNQAEIEQISLRQLSTHAVFKAFMSKVKQSTVIIYLGYHHRNLFTNITLMHKILSFLYKNKWQGKFIFFNTQAIFLQKITVNSNQDTSFNPIIPCDLYIFTKKIQAFLLKKYASYFQIYELFLPVVIGEDTNWGANFKRISAFKNIYLPQKGLNTFAYLNIQVFVNWFWKYLTQEKEEINYIRQIFVYEGISSFDKVINEVSIIKNSKVKKINDLKHRYRYESNFIKNSIWYFKISIFGFLISTIRGIFLKDSAAVNSNPPEVVDSFDSGSYIPTGLEYQFFQKSIDISRIPFETIQVPHS